MGYLCVSCEFLPLYVLNDHSIFNDPRDLLPLSQLFQISSEKLGHFNSKLKTTLSSKRLELEGFWYHFWALDFGNTIAWTWVSWKYFKWIVRNCQDLGNGNSNRLRDKAVLKFWTKWPNFLLCLLCYVFSGLVG